MPEQYRLQVFLPPTYKERIRRAAHEEYMTVQKLMARVVTDYLDTHEAARQEGGAVPEGSASPSSASSPA